MANLSSSKALSSEGFDEGGAMMTTGPMTTGLNTPGLKTTMGGKGPRRTISTLRNQEQRLTYNTFQGNLELLNQT